MYYVSVLCSYLYEFIHHFFFFLLILRLPKSTLFPYTTLFRSEEAKKIVSDLGDGIKGWFADKLGIHSPSRVFKGYRSEEHTSELQSLRHLVCRLLLEKKKKNKNNTENTI